MRFVTVKCEDDTMYMIPYENIDLIIYRPGEYYSVWLNKNSTVSAIEKVTEIGYD